MSFACTEYGYCAAFEAAFAAVIYSLISWGQNTTLGALTTLAFILGALTSILSGYIGMKVAVYANARTTIDCAQGKHIFSYIPFLVDSLNILLNPLWKDEVVCILLLISPISLVVLLRSSRCGLSTWFQHGLSSRLVIAPFLLTLTYPFLLFIYIYIFLIRLTGAVMGFCLPGFGLLVLYLSLLAYKNVFEQDQWTVLMECISG